MLEYYIIPLFILLPGIIVGLLRIHSFDKTLKPIVFLTILNIFEIIISYYFYSTFQNTQPVTHIYSFFYIINLWWFFYEYKYTDRVILAISSMVTILLIFANTVFIEDIYIFPSNSVMLVCIYTVGHSMNALLKTIENETDIFRKGFFWFLLMNILFFTFNFFIFGTANLENNLFDKLLFSFSSILLPFAYLQYLSWTVTILINSSLKKTVYGNRS